MKKSHEHLGYSALVSTFLLATGNILGAFMSVGLGAFLDHTENKDFERRQAEIEASTPKKPTLEELNAYRHADNEAYDIIKEISQIKEAEKILGMFPDYKCNSKENKVHIEIDCPYGVPIFPRAGKGSVTFCKGMTRIGQKYPAVIYCKEIFKEVLQYDLSQNKEIKVYSLVGSSKGLWLYTVDCGKSYKVCGIYEGFI